MYGYNNEKVFINGVVCGALIGTLTTLLFTTKQGKKIQDKIVDTYEDLEDSVKHGLSESKEKLQDVAKDAKKKLLPGDDKNSRDDNKNARDDNKRG